METFKWPLTLIACLIVFFAFFRQSIDGLIGRIRRVGYGDKSVDLADDLQGTAVEQQKEVESPSAGSEMIPATHAMPPPNEVTAEIEAEIGTALRSASYSPNVEKAWLIRAISSRPLRSHFGVRLYCDGAV